MNMNKRDSNSLDSIFFCHDDHTYCGRDNQPDKPSDFDTLIGDVFYDTVGFDSYGDIDAQLGDRFEFRYNDFDSVDPINFDELQFEGITPFSCDTNFINDVNVTTEQNDLVKRTMNLYEDHRVPVSTWDNNDHRTSFDTLEMFGLLDDSDVSLDLIEPTLTELDITNEEVYSNMFGQRYTDIAVENTFHVTENKLVSKTLTQDDSSCIFKEFDCHCGDSYFTEDDDFFETDSPFLPKSYYNSDQSSSILTEYSHLPMHSHDSFTSSYNLEQSVNLFPISRDRECISTNHTVTCNANYFQSNGEAYASEKHPFDQYYFDNTLYAPGTDLSDWDYCSTSVNSNSTCNGHNFDLGVSHGNYNLTVNNQNQNQYNVNLPTTLESPHVTTSKFGEDIQSHHTAQDNMLTNALSHKNGDNHDSSLFSFRSNEFVENEAFNDIHPLIQSSYQGVHEPDPFMLEVSSKEDGWEIQTKHYADGSVYTNYVNEIDLKPVRNDLPSNVSVESSSHYFQNWDDQFSHQVTSVDSDVSAHSTSADTPISIHHDCFQQSPFVYDTMSLQGDMDNNCLINDLESSANYLDEESMVQMDTVFHNMSNQDPQEERSVQLIQKSPTAVSYGVIVQPVQTQQSYRANHIRFLPLLHLNDLVCGAQVSKGKHQIDKSCSADEYGNVIYQLSQNEHDEVQEQVMRDPEYISPTKTGKASSVHNNNVNTMTSLNYTPNSLVMTYGSIKDINREETSSNKGSNGCQIANKQFPSNQMSMKILSNVQKKESVKNGKIIKNMKVEKNGDGLFHVKRFHNEGQGKGSICDGQSSKKKRLVSVLVNAPTISSSITSNTSCDVSGNESFKRHRKVVESSTTPKTDNIMRRDIHFVKSLERPFKGQCKKNKIVTKKQTDSSNKKLDSKVKTKTPVKNLRESPCKILACQQFTKKRKKSARKVDASRQEIDKSQSKISLGMENVFVSVKIRDILYKNVKDVKCCFTEEPRKTDKEAQQEWKKSVRLLRENKLKRLDCERKKKYPLITGTRVTQ